MHLCDGFVFSLCDHAMLCTYKKRERERGSIQFPRAHYLLSKDVRLPCNGFLLQKLSEVIYLDTIWRGSFHVVVISLTLASLRLPGLVAPYSHILISVPHKMYHLFLPHKTICALLERHCLLPFLLLCYLQIESPASDFCG